MSGFAGGGLLIGALEHAQEAPAAKLQPAREAGQGPTALGGATADGWWKPQQQQGRQRQRQLPPAHLGIQRAARCCVYESSRFLTSGSQMYNNLISTLVDCRLLPERHRHMCPPHRDPKCPYWISNGLAAGGRGTSSHARAAGATKLVGRMAALVVGISRVAWQSGRVRSTLRQNCCRRATWLEAVGASGEKSPTVQLYSAVATLSHARAGLASNVQIRSERSNACTTPIPRV